MVLSVIHINKLPNFIDIWDEPKISMEKCYCWNDAPPLLPLGYSSSALEIPPFTLKVISRET